MPSGPSPTKRRAACDECRFRKVKCSGGEPCRNCQNYQAPCTYSTSRPLGRPRKRRRASAEDSFTTQQTSTASSTIEAFNIDDTFDQAALLDDLSLLSPEFPADAFSSLDTSTSPSAAAPSTIPCSCLSLAYLTIARLQFPATAADDDLTPSLADIHSALASAAAILKCAQCPKQMVTAIQNLYQLCALLTSIVGRMQTMLSKVDARVQSSPSARTSSRHDALMLSAQIPGQDFDAMSEHQFRLFFRRMLKDTVLGSSVDKGDVTLLGIVNQFERRQTEWHEDPRMYEEQAKMFGKRTATDFAHECESRVCYRLIESIKNSISSLEL